MTIANHPSATALTYLGIFLVAAATLMFEILLTRIFSVMLWYHFAFLAVSVAMFGMSAGSMLVYLRWRGASTEFINKRLALNSLLFSISIALSVAIALELPTFSQLLNVALAPLITPILAYIVVSPPFFLSGVCISLLLSRFVKSTSRLYAADLCGAAFGCMALVALLNIVDALTAVFIISAVSACSAFCFAASIPKAGFRLAAAVLAIGFAAASIAHSVFPASVFPIMRLDLVKFQRPVDVLFEKWNSYSQITVLGKPDLLQKPFAWAPSKEFDSSKPVHRLEVHIDGNARTVMTGFDGNVDNLSFLREDMINFGHMLRPSSDVLVIGVGGGRDVLSALAFGQRSVVGVEINDVILNLLKHEFGEFSGHLDRHPQVKLINDEARSYLAAHPDKKFDIIQLSLVDTLAATSSGGFVLTENSLYTVEGWNVFLRHLTDRGVLAVSRWYHEGLPAESYRIVSLAAESLRDIGVSRPRDHILMSRCKSPEGNYDVATILVSKSPFLPIDIERFNQLCQQKGFSIVLSPAFAADDIFNRLTSGKDDRFIADFPLEIRAPTDDKPYFFQMLKLSHLWDSIVWASDRSNKALEVYGNLFAVLTLALVLVLVSVLTFSCILAPAFLAASWGKIRSNWALSSVFACIGFGFMLIEITQMQRLILLLGHPVYGLSIVLFGLLIAGGIGSYWTAAVGDDKLASQGLACFGFIIAVLIVAGIVTPFAVTQFQEHSIFVRVAVALAILLPMGLVMGMASPLSMRLANRTAPDLSAWFWGVNGATSVCASVIAVALGLSFGISTAYWLGCLVYAGATAAFAWAGANAAHG